MHMNRYKAFLVHLGISALIVSLLLLLVFFAWYPSPLFTVEGTRLPLQILVAVDIIIGPLLTLVVFKPGKPSLKMDLSIIAAIQVAAFVYGASVVYTERPAFVAFAESDFTVVSVAETRELEMHRLDREKVRLNAFGPTYVYAEIPRDPAVVSQIIYEIVNGGKDFSHRPQFYRDLESNIERSFPKAMDLEGYVLKYPGKKPAIDAFLSGHQTKLEDIVAFPLKGKHHDMVIVLDRASKNIIGAIDINPWLPVDDKKTAI